MVKAVCCHGDRQTNLDGDGAAPFEDEVAALEVLVGGAAQLDVHLLRAEDTTLINHRAQTQTAHNATPLHRHALELKGWLTSVP